MKLFHGDCLDLMGQIPDQSVDMVLADLPYGTTACKWDVCIPFEPLWKELHRVCKPTAAMCMFGSEPFSSKMRMSNLKDFKYDWVWIKSLKTNFLNAKKQPLRQVEVISVFYDKQSKYFPIGLRKGKQSPGSRKITACYGSFKQHFNQEYTGYPSEVLYFDRTGKNAYLHPNQKPVALLEYLIKTYTNEGDTVLDPTMGSGSTGVACKNLNRKFIGIEKEEKYFEIVKQRMKTQPWEKI